MSNDKLREEFEVWQIDSHSGPFTDPFWLVRDSKDPDRYALLEIQISWRAWQASRAAVVVELPPAPEVPEDPEEAIDDSHMDAYHSAIGMRHACAQFIKACGLQVKP